MTDPTRGAPATPEPTLEELEACRKEHARDLRRLEKMTDEQFEGFKRNFELGLLDPTITRREAIDILRSMICTNLTLQQEKRSADDKPVAPDGPPWYPGNGDERE